MSAEILRAASDADWLRDAAFLDGREEPMPREAPRERDGVLTFRVASDGTTGPGWIHRLENRGLLVNTPAREILRTSNFMPTTDVVTEIAVLKDSLFDDRRLDSLSVRSEANRRNLVTPTVEAGCLLCEAVMRGDVEAIGLDWILVMHDPINVVIGPHVLGTRHNRSGRGLVAGRDGPGERWGRGGGFAFAVM